jgi:membrane protease YdiL (CAAX protease family)
MKAAGMAEGKSASSQLLLLTGLALGGISIFSFLSVLFVWLVFGVNIAGQPSAISNFQDAETINILKAMQVFQSLGLFVIPPLILAYLVSAKPLTWLNLKLSHKTGFQLLMTFFLMISCQPFINWFAAWNASIPVSEWMQEAEKRAADITLAFLGNTDVFGLIVNIMVVGILPGIGEELFFRGVIQKLFIKASGNGHAGIWIAAFIFSAIHMQFLGFFPRFFLGALFGYLAMWSGSLWLPIFAHTLNNTTAVLIHWLVVRGNLPAGSEEIGSENQDLLWVLSGTFVCLWFLKVIHDINWKRQTTGSDLSE